jgi:hypothetical protein
VAPVCEEVAVSTTWLGLVGDLGGSSLASLVICPDEDEQYRQACSGLARAGFGRVSPAELRRLVWPVALTTYVYLSGREMSHVHTGRARLQPARPLEMTPRWLATVRAGGRALVVLAPPGGLGEVADRPDGLLDDDGHAGVARMLDGLASRRALIAALANAMDIPAGVSSR